ncbi:Kelch domain-containing protein 10 [Mytilus coruscus]|uniref:Kelch domain-containing protein 10 n=1 Tax=Mytilus coruscus TaxID=42192 RepID=A0A6J8EC92_MYTCO|nr:Kelch domain-containing protein 10 [Mytilus coruscus]
MALTVQKFQTVGPVEQDEDVENENVHPNDIDMDRLYPRSGHRAVVDDSNMYVLGGYNPRFRHVENSPDTYYPLFKELWKFNFTTQKWTSLITDGTMPTELASHAALRCGRNLLYFGGTGVPFGHSSSNDYYTCNLDTLKWRYVKCQGDIPQKKYGHAMARVGKDVFVCGGTTGFVYNMDIHRLDIYTGVWEHLPVHSKYTPSSRYVKMLVWYYYKHEKQDDP